MNFDTEWRKGWSKSDPSFRQNFENSCRDPGEKELDTPRRMTLSCQTVAEIQNSREKRLCTQHELCLQENDISQGLHGMDLFSNGPTGKGPEDETTSLIRNPLENFKRLRNKLNAARKSEVLLGRDLRPFEVTDTENKRHISKEAEGVKSLLRERSFRQKLNAEKKIMRDMVKHPRDVASSSSARKSLPCIKTYENNFPNSNTRHSFFSVAHGIGSNQGRSMNAIDEAKVDEKMGTAELECKPHLQKDDFLRERAFTMPSLFRRPDGQRYPPYYWLTCTYKLVSYDDSLHVTVRQTGTLPKIQGKLCAKIFIEQETETYHVTLAESQNDNSFRSHELIFQKQRETFGKILVFKLYDHRRVFAKTAVGDWRIPLDDCSEREKIMCEKFCSRKLND